VARRHWIYVIKKHAVSGKTGSAQHIPIPAEEDQAIAIGAANVHKNLVTFRRAVLEI